jgi:DNA-binding transcriptional LysR family regulator
MDIDLTRLKYFVAVADELHFKRAADRLGITPPPLSKQIKLLETGLGGPLFERRYHGVSLTPLGSALVEPARRILGEVEDLKRLVERSTGQSPPTRIGATAYAPSEFLELLQAAAADLPEGLPSAFQVSGSAAEVTTQLLSGQLDIGLIHLPVTDDALDHRTVVRYRSAVAVRSDDPLAGRREVSIDDLRDRQLVIDFARPNPTLLALHVQRLASLGLTRIVHATATNRGSELEIAAQVRSRGLAVLVADAPHSAIGRIFSPPDFAMIPLSTDEIGAELALAWRRDRMRSAPGIPRIVDELARRLQPHP